MFLTPPPRKRGLNALALFYFVSKVSVGSRRNLPEKLWGSFSHGSTRSAGVAVLLSNFKSHFVSQEVKGTVHPKMKIQS